MEEEPILSIEAQPEDAAPVDGVAEFSVRVSVNGAEEVAYQWQRLDESMAYETRQEREDAWQDIVGETADTLRIPGLDDEEMLAYAAGYAYRCVICVKETQVVTREAHILRWAVAPETDEEPLPLPAEGENANDIQGSCSHTYTYTYTAAGHSQHTKKGTCSKCGATTSSKENHTWSGGKCSLCGCYKPLTANGTYDVTASGGVQLYSSNNSGSTKVKVVAKGNCLTVTNVAAASSGYYWGKVTKVGTTTQSSAAYVCMKSSEMQAHSHTYTYTYENANNVQHTKKTMLQFMSQITVMSASWNAYETAVNRIRQGDHSEAAVAAVRRQFVAYKSSLLVLYDTMVDMASNHLFGIGEDSVLINYLQYEKDQIESVYLTNDVDQFVWAISLEEYKRLH